MALAWLAWLTGSRFVKTHANVRTPLTCRHWNLSFQKIERITVIVLHKVCTDSSQIIFDLLQRVKPNIAHLDVLSMIHDLLHFFHERNQPNFTLVVINFYNGLRNVHYHEHLKNLVSACEPLLRFLYLCCLLWFDSSLLIVEVTVQCVVYKFLWAVPSKNINRISILKQNYMQKNVWMPFIQRSQMFV